MPTLTHRISSAFGVARSLIIYWRPGRQPGLRSLYRPFITPGSPAFDIGAHVGDRSAAFHSLGARVVALEPQPALARWCQRMAGRDVILLPMAAGPSSGQAEIAISPGNPTVSTLSKAWRQQVSQRNAGFAKVRWKTHQRVEVTTLDALIDQYGLPTFIKIDVEGFEADVLAGLSQPVAALSFEFVAGTLNVGHECLKHLERLGNYRFNVVEGEQREFYWPHWQTADQTHAWLAAGADNLASGDIYACQVGHPVLQGSSD
ncbi:FkbM family methyltransferase [Halomonas sp. LS-001]